MANPNAIVSEVRRIHPFVDRFVVDFADGRSVRLDRADPRSADLARAFESASDLGVAVYVEANPDTDTVTRLLIPLVARVVAVRSAGDDLVVELMPSHARHVLRSTHADFEEMRGLFYDAARSGEALLVTDDERHDIIDVRRSPKPPLELGPPPSRREGVRQLLQKIWRWSRWPWRRVGCMSPAQAQRVFDTLSATSCDPRTPHAPCIPFLYPDNGCWGRASEMCRLMIGMGLAPRKVWIRSSWPNHLRVSTRNNPHCAVNWVWHVAPTHCVSGSSPFGTTMVFDPALFTTPVTEPAWKAVQGDPNATLTETDASVFMLFLLGNATDPAYVLTDACLAFYRLALWARSALHGPPPYANCP